MLGIGGRFVGAKGMVAVPNLSSLSRSAAQAAITNAGLSFIENSSPVDTTNSALGDKVSGQSVSPGTLVDYESSISYSYFRYVAPPPSGPVPVGPPERLQIWVSGSVSRCSGTTRVVTPTEQLQISYRTTFTDGTTQTVRAPQEDGPVTEITNDSTYQYNSTECGYVPPACNPTYVDSAPVPGPCINGSQIMTITSRDVTCDNPPLSRSYTQSCCVPEQIFVSYWQGSCINCYRLTATRYRDSCTGVETVYNNSQYCCSGGGGGAQVAL